MKTLFAWPLGALACLTSTLHAGSFDLPAWAFDRGNVRVFTDQWADTAPMVAYGGRSPILVEYDFELPRDGGYQLKVQYAAADARPVTLTLDARRRGEVCRTATGSWLTSGSAWEDSLELELTAGKHTLRLEREGAFPHLVALRLESEVIPDGFQPTRPRTYKLPERAALVAGNAFDNIPNPATLRRAIEDLIATFGSRYPRGREFLARLDALEAGLPQHADRPDKSDPSDWTALQRAALLANPLLDFDRLLVLKRGFPKPSEARRALGQALGVGSLNAHTSDDTPRQGRWNDELSILSNLRGQPSWQQVHAPDSQETVIDPVLHFDGNRLLFAMNGAREKNWRLWEIGVDGHGLRQVTPDEGADVGHFDPCYLPDGRIVFASTAVYQGLPCEFGAQAMTCLYQMDPATQAIRQLTFEQDSDWCPTMLPNGRVLYLRWEYTDQSHANSRILFHMNPDGTDQREFRGSGSWFPGSFFYAKPIPGEPHQVVGIATGHHGIPRSGRLLILDPSAGRRDGEGIVQEIPGRGKTVEPIVRDRLIDGVWPQFLMPWPLSAKYHIVAAKLAPDALWGIYLADVFDNLTLITEVEGAALLWPIPLQATPTPPIVPDRVNLASDQATVFIADVHSGPGLQGVPRGTVKALRIIEYYFSRRGFGGLYGTLGLDGPWDVKRILGTVPVEPDGSAYFTIPANSPLTIQPIDKSGQALQLMRSWLVGMPGEAVSCAGCHEPQNEVTAPRPAIAALRPPSSIEPWHGPARGFAYEREVQPVVDRYCVSCHDSRHGASSPPALQADQQLTDWSSQLAGRWVGGGRFTESYFQLQRYVRRPGIEGDRRMFTPLDYHFNTTELGQLLAKGHHGVTLDAEAWDRLATWVDLNAPFHGTWGEIPQFCEDPAGAIKLAEVNSRAMALRRRHVPMGPHPDYDAIPETPAYNTTPVIPVEPVRPRDFIGSADPHSTNDWPFDAKTAVARQHAASVAGQITRTLDLGEGVTLDLVRIPGGTFAMGSTEGPLDEAPRAWVEVAPFWMARFETSNRQFRRFLPEHESRTEDRHGYQFGRLGYDLDQPEQPVVRVSWDQAVGFCAWLTSRTGLQVALPTEAQWEWACRAGTDTPFWFGALDADYSHAANLGDQRLAEFAADTALDNYTAARPMVNPNRYDDWIPRDDRFDDGGFVTVAAGSYEPNPWGLHDLHGNVWEWTRSTFAAYPYAGDDGRNDPEATGPRVVRGGSWYDRPKRCTSSYRLGYPRWQRVYNVGFRIIARDSEAVPGTSLSKLDRQPGSF
ncbi:MAG: SUMF1/EgtB/PvdO family nonheme iron enzyme [Verrucomicrobiales bacterium]|nr:SUMF1/EgtB/PvdO family nonheme iron enzyme [Verrucomicrobiales bacterium]